MSALDDHTWREHAVCRGKTAVFFPERLDHTDAPIDNEVQAAIAICATCPVTEPCLEWALTYRERGVWGGTSENDRRRIRSRARRAGEPLPTVRTITPFDDGTPRRRPKPLDVRVDPIIRDICGQLAGFRAHYRARPRERPCDACSAHRRETRPSESRNQPHTTQENPPCQSHSMV